MLGGVHAGHRSVDSVVVGCLLTLLAIAADSAGWLAPFESLLYDFRASTFQHFLPPPTDRLVHLDIDEGALAAVRATEKERFPWPRSILAEMMDEVALAGPKVVGLDVIFPEAQAPDWRPQGDPAPAARPGHGTVVRGPFEAVDHDVALSRSLKRLGAALVPVSLPFERPRAPSDLEASLRAELARDLNLPPAALVGRLHGRGFAGSDLPARVANEYLAAWRAEMAAAIRREMRAAAVAGARPTTTAAAAAAAAGPPDREAVRAKLLKPGLSDVVLRGAFDELYDQALSAAIIYRFSRPIPAGAPPLFATTLDHLPVPPLAEAAAYSAYVNHPQFRDAHVRALPLLLAHENRMYPQMGLAMACAALDVDLGSLRVGPDSIGIPLPDGREIVVPHRAIHSADLAQDVPTFMDIPWWGGNDWTTMYDHPNHRRPAAHVSAAALWDLVLARRKLARNVGAVDAALVALLGVLSETAADAYVAAPPPPDDLAARRAVYERHRADAADFVELIHGPGAPPPDERTKRFLAACERLPALLRESEGVGRHLRDGRAELRRQLGGKAVFVGWTFTGAAADFVPTSVHAKAPGVVLHGAVFNAILTGEMWRSLPRWATYLTTALLGLCMTAAAAFLTPSRALVVALVLGGGYALVNGVVLFDYGNRVLGAAGPLVCVAGVWQGCTLVRLVAERYQRSRIEGRFRSYVDPALVDYVVRHPDQVKLEGQVREMTVCFSDLGNFTPLTAQLKEATVPLLNRLFGAMVPEIRRNNGYVNKFLGDGVMFFFGAPRTNPDHARDALRTVLDIQREVRRVNAELSAEGLPNIELRVGINTGNMVVGDAGSEQASDYTVLGDSVNLASRLESANKQLGTANLISARTAALAGGAAGGWLLRPVGQICVVGRSEPVVAYEMLGRSDEATDDQRRLAALTGEMVDAFRDARFADCLRAAGQLDAGFGPGKLARLYRERCEFFLAHPPQPDPPFDCTLTLSEK
jgi:class 3 adenylate cyclase